MGILIWLVAFFLPPFAVLMLPNSCTKNKAMDFLVAFVLWLIFAPLAWLYVFPMISDCHVTEQPAVSPQPAPAAPAAPTTGKVTGQKVIVINVGQQ